VHYLLETIRIRMRIKQSDPNPYNLEKHDPIRIKVKKQDPDPYQKGLDSKHWFFVNWMDKFSAA
jgi:hypothetical protein